MKLDRLNWLLNVASFNYSALICYHKTPNDNCFERTSLINDYFQCYQKRRHQPSSAGSHIPRPGAVKIAFGEFIAQQS